MEDSSGRGCGIPLEDSKEGGAGEGGGAFMIIINSPLCIVSLALSLMYAIAYNNYSGVY